MLAPLAIAAVLVAGHSAGGRPIVAQQLGDRAGGERVLVVGCIHGTECAGMRVVRALRSMPLPPGVDLWLVPNLDPDGLAEATRVNGRGVDLNRNFPAGWRPGGRPGDLQYPGTQPFSEPETRAARRLIDQIRPEVTIWYHQHMNLVWAWGRSRATGAAYARAARMRFAPMSWLAGTAPRWQNTALGERSFVVELPAGPLTVGAARRHAEAVLAAGLACAACPSCSSWSPMRSAASPPATCSSAAPPASTSGRRARGAPERATPAAQRAAGSAPPCSCSMSPRAPSPSAWRR
jgi:protein MpaA